MEVVNNIIVVTFLQKVVNQQFPWARNFNDMGNKQR